ncbi:MAG: alpha-amylase family glycosyl hydrolase [Candidatus Marinimicrobia bacterium]|nr:alpha-amylase family glycosyl hydrolase [Candidatus Neomarinimicrobiota bacterium]
MSRKERRYESAKFIHNLEPDYQKVYLEIPDDFREKILTKLSRLYGEDTAKEYMPELERICRVYYAYKTEEMLERTKTLDPKNLFTEEDVILITYGDLIREEGASPLTTLSKFCGLYLKQTINTLHILPFFPYSSDRGFAIEDFETVDPELGSWKDIEDLASRYKLMFDGVINHVSSKSRWFQRFLDGTPHYKDFFISYDSYDDLTSEERSAIFRPRTTDILTKFHTIDGEKHIWSTFSKDQIDLNYKNPEVLVRVIEILLLYARKGAVIIRLDAVTFLWANPGTSCANLEETHMIVKVFRDILDLVAPHVSIITETNIPHKDNISYFGNGSDEAHMVYNFALPPLVLHTFYTKDTTRLNEWAESLKPPSETTAYFNFLDSHDGVGLMAVKDLLSHDEIQFIIRRAREHGGYISYKTDKDGQEVPYEINITWFNALCREDGTPHTDLQVDIFIASRAMALALQGVPGIYLHSFFGTRNDIDVVSCPISKREVNRKALDYNTLTKAIDDPDTLTSKIIRKLNSIISLRTKQSAFHPNGAQKILKVKPEIFAVLRTSPNEDQHILSLINITDDEIQIAIPLREVQVLKQEWYDLISQDKHTFKDENISLTLKPYDIVWLEPQ